ncbi:Acetylornithine aminotransferase [Propionispora sp. 2/2-37]|uniref:aminotransferase class III-fold pyridoxal phosphate-dependent enzyme n=1 Tax=Propionispora sp. 2/2-37 TaxID=1677858 RepID=UPI0006BFE577|nr:aminotransferase class III-fold pyridoxal phosphate-dependent enzyme [Propionispora sp. 2/2-37]CUH95571.1 Acetylornithine aminotransferase [Propionispora sp. 2/2-37]
MDSKTIVSETIANYEQFVNPAIARLFRFMGLATVEYRAEGYLIEDIDGHQYIDCLGGYGVFSLGHRHPKVVESVKRQLDRMPLSGKVLFNQTMGELAAVLSEITPGNLQYSFLVNSGTEAVEGALKLARLHTGREEFVSTVNAFHGKTFGALSATGRDLFCDPFRPLLDGFRHVPYGDIHAMEETMNERVAAVIVEPIQGEGGIVVPPEGYLAAVRSLCDQYGSLLICDEVQTGLGRTGKMFAVEHFNVVPDIMTLAKALGGGVMPVGAFIARPAVWDKYIVSPFLHTSTFGGNPLACAAALAAVRVIQEEDLPGQAAATGKYFVSCLEQVRKAYPDVIEEVRGRGLMIGIALTKEGAGGVMMSELITRGVLVAYTLNNPKVIRLEPPLTIPVVAVDQIVHAIGESAQIAHSMIDDL